MRINITVIFKSGKELTFKAKKFNWSNGGGGGYSWTIEGMGGDKVINELDLNEVVAIYTHRSWWARFMSLFS